MHPGSIDTLRRPWPLPAEPRVAGRRSGSAILFGIAAPLVCLALDPCVFRSGGALAILGLPLAGAYAVAAYALVGIAFAALIAWLMKPRWGPWLAGPLAASGLAALGVAVLLLPLSLVGTLLAGVGLFGLLPFGTAWVYLRAGWRAWRLVPRRRRMRARAVALVLGGLTVGLPLLAQHAVDQRTHELVRAALHGDDAALERAVERLKPFGWLADAGIPFRSWSASEMDAPPSSRRLGAAWEAAGGAPLQAAVD